MIRSLSDYRMLRTAYSHRMEQAKREQSKLKKLGRQLELFEHDYRRKERAERDAPAVPQDLTLTPEERRAWPEMSRAGRWQLVRIKRGLCASCGKEPLVSARLGEACLLKQRERMRERTGAEPRKN